MTQSFGQWTVDGLRGTLISALVHEVCMAEVDHHDRHFRLLLPHHRSSQGGHHREDAIVRPSLL